MKYTTLLTALTLLSAVLFTGCKGKREYREDTDMGYDASLYAQEWNEVEKYTDKSKPKSALKVVENIYKDAKEKQHIPQYVKAVIHKMVFMQQIEEESIVKVQEFLTEELKDAPFPADAVLHSMMAQMYWEYFNQNRYLFYGRTKTAETNELDMRTWSLDKIVMEIVEHYKKSLEQPEKLQEVPIRSFESVLYLASESALYRPTLYDFLAHRSVDFFMNSEAGLTRPADGFDLNNRAYFEMNGKFSKLSITSEDELSFDYYALKVLQDLIKFHLGDKKNSALIDVDLKRLAFVHSRAVVSGKDELLEQVLLKMIKRYKKDPSCSQVYYELAALYEKMGSRYRPGGNEEYRWHRKKALELCEKTIKEYETGYGTDLCKALRSTLLEKQLSVSLERSNVPLKPLRGLVTYRNTSSLYFKVIKTTYEEMRKARNMNYEKQIDFFLSRGAVQNFTLDMKDVSDYQQHSAEFPLEGLEPGEYVVLTANNGDFSYKKNAVAFNFITVSDISFIKRNTSGEGMEFFMLHSDTGAPLEGCQARLWYNVYNKLLRRYDMKKGDLYTADKNGYFTVEKMPVGAEYNNFYLEFLYKKQRLFSEEDFYLQGSYQQETTGRITHFFTDRAIYRPGQTVYFKGIMLSRDTLDGEKNRILPNSGGSVVLYDVNGQEVHRLSVTSNSYGTFSGTFQLPTGVLTGTMQLRDDYGYTSIQVEEYKRPGFEVTFDKTDSEFSLDEKVKLTGTARAFAGFGIDNAKVSYRVVRNVFYPYSWYFWGYMPPSQQTQLVNGSTTTDGSGAFTVEFVSVPDPTVSKENQPAFSYTIYADITDINGETRSASKTVNIGYTSLIVNGTFPEIADKDSGVLTYSLNTTNLSYEFLKAAGNITIYKLAHPGNLQRTRLWNKPDVFLLEKEKYRTLFPYDIYDDEDNKLSWKREKEVYKTSFDTALSKTGSIKNLAGWQPGAYLAEIISKDSRGNKVKDIKIFTLVSKQAGKLPYPMKGAVIPLKTAGEPGEEAVFLVGSAEKSRIIYEIEHRGKIISREYLDLNNEQKKITIDITEKHRGNFSVHFSTAGHNRIQLSSYLVWVPWTNKELDISFETFRDKLLPGQDEQWKIKIKGKDGERLAAEMAAALYDSSLDAYRMHNWYFSIFPGLYTRQSWQSSYLAAISGSYLIGNLNPDYVSYYNRSYSQLNWFGFDFYYYYYRSRGDEKRSTILFKNKDEAMPTEAVLDDIVMSESEESNTEQMSPATVEDAETDSSPADRREAQQNGGEVQVRTNFNETAFFYPHLETNAEGEIIIAFTIPESLTRWKMLGFAHTKDLKFGLVTNELVTRKELMVLPNAPRFFREGDTMEFTAKITSMSDKTLSGKAVLSLFDAKTMENLDGLFANGLPRQNFTVKEGQSTRVGWKIKVPEGIGAVTYRITAQSGRFSDGEENALPVLKNSMLVTETLPLPLSSGQTRQFTFTKLKNSGGSDTLRHHKLTLEFTSNPAWYAVQAIPYIMEYPYECMEQTFSRYYANTLASHIVSSNPAIEKVFKKWQELPESNQLLSNLEKNQELKALLLEETPWVMEAQDETERKRRIAFLFDTARMTNELAAALKKLTEGQESSGGWPWFKGMYPNRYMTQHIISGFGHLDKLGALSIEQDNRITQMVHRAVVYLDEQIRKDYTYLITNGINLKQQNIGYTQIHYLYMRSFFQGIALSGVNKTAYNYYFKQAAQYWPEFNKYMQGMTALALHRGKAGAKEKDNKTAVEIMESIKEHALYSDEMGMYWKESYGYYWYEAGIEMQALLIEAFLEISGDTASVDQMKTWLLKSKQTQDWGTTKATVEACYALLLQGDNWLKETRLPDISLGTIKVDPANDKNITVEEGTGYFKTSWEKDEIKPGMAEITVTNNNQVPAWGGVYWQYFEQLDKITFAETGLKIKKELFVEVKTKTGPTLVPITKKKAAVGDRIIVRIEIRSDRDMEYVHMKDMRAAAFEPENVISRYKWQDGLGYYEATRDGSTNFFIDFLPKGTYVFEYPLRVTHEGDFSNGITTLQCMYAPEFTSHSEGVRVKID